MYSKPSSGFVKVLMRAFSKPNLIIDSHTRLFMGSSSISRKLGASPDINTIKIYSRGPAANNIFDFRLEELLLHSCLVSSRQTWGRTRSISVNLAERISVSSKFFCLSSFNSKSVSIRYAASGWGAGLAYSVRKSTIMLITRRILDRVFPKIKQGFY